MECFLAGFRYYEGEAVFPEMGRGMRLDLRPEPDNAYDSSAVAVYFRDRKIGYVPREKNRLVRAMFDGLRGVPGAQILELNPDGDDWARIKIGVGF